MHDLAQLTDTPDRMDTELGLASDQVRILEKLTPKQREVLRLTLGGRTSKEIAQQLGIHHRSVDQRLDGARVILGASTRAEAARKFFELHRASEGLTSDPFMLGDGGLEQRSETGEQSTYVFGDALTFSPDPVWEHCAEVRPDTWRRFVPGLPSAASGSGDRIMWIVIGAVSTLTLVLIGLAVVESLKRLVGGG